MCHTKRDFIDVILKGSSFLSCQKGAYVSWHKGVYRCHTRGVLMCVMPKRTPYVCHATCAIYTVCPTKFKVRTEQIKVVKGGSWVLGLVEGYRL